jgi:hypothetical protein
VLVAGFKPFGGVALDTLRTTDLRAGEGALD